VETLKKWGKRVLFVVGAMALILVGMMMAPAGETEQVPAATHTPYPTPEPLPTHTPYPTPEPTYAPVPTSRPEPTVALEIYNEQEFLVMFTLHVCNSAFCETIKEYRAAFLSGDASLQYEAFLAVWAVDSVTIEALAMTSLAGVGGKVRDLYRDTLETAESVVGMCDVGMELTSTGVAAPRDTMVDWLDAAGELCDLLATSAIWEPFR